MKIAIIGGGWVGCHLANKLRDVHKVTIFEKNAKLFQESSYSNQNRLHRGYHYARNSKTRELCEKTFTRFTNDYSFMVEPVHNNAYAVPNESVLDYGTYKKIFYDYHFSEVDFGLDNLKDIILVDERYINFEKANEYFNFKLNDIVINTEVTNAEALKEDFDLVINCTNNHIRDPKCTDAFYEIALSISQLLKWVYCYSEIATIKSDKDFAIVHDSNMSKLCDTEADAQATVADYADKFAAGNSPYDSPYYYELPKLGKWIVKNKSTGKALKNIKYCKVQF